MVRSIRLSGTVEPVDVEGVKVWYFQSNSLRRLYYAPALAARSGNLSASFPSFTRTRSISGRCGPRRVRRDAPACRTVVSPRGMLEKD
jgi:hypothetical protein